MAEVVGATATVYHEEQLGADGIVSMPSDEKKEQTQISIKQDSLNKQYKSRVVCDGMNGLYSKKSSACAGENGSASRTFPVIDWQT